MRITNKLLLFINIFLISTFPAFAQLPWFLQRFMPSKYSLLGSASFSPPTYGPPPNRPPSPSPAFGSSSIFSPYVSSSSLSPALVGFPPPVGPYSYGTAKLGTPTLLPSKLADLEYGLLGSSSHGHSLIGPHGSALLGTPSFRIPSYGSSFGSLSPSSYLSSGLLSSSSFASPNFLALSSFGSPKFASLDFGGHSFGDLHSFDGYEGIDADDDVNVYGGLSGGLKDYNTAESHKSVFSSQSPYANDYDFLKRSATK